MTPLAALAVRRVHVLPVVPPGAELLGLRVAAAARRRGWALAGTVREADVLAVCGPVDGELGEAVDAAWASVASPHARRRIAAADAIEGAFDSARRVLADDALQRSTGWVRPPAEAARPTTSWRFGPVAAGAPAGLLLEGEAERGRVRTASVRVLAGAGPAEEDPLEPDAVGPVLAAAGAARVLALGGRAADAARLTGAVDAVLSGGAVESLRRTARRISQRARGSAVLAANLAGPLAPVRDGLLGALDVAGGGRGGAGPADPEAAAAALPGRPVAWVPLLVAAAALPAVADA